MNAHVQSIRAIFDEASEIADAEQRRAFVARACDDNEALRREVEELLAAHETAGGFLADPKRDESAALTPSLSLARPPQDGAWEARGSLAVELQEQGAPQ